MPNAFLKAESIAAAALGLLQRELVLPRLVQSFGLSDYAGAKDDTITVRVPAILAARDYEWRTRSAPIVVDDIVESSIPVTLNRHVYHAGALTDEQLTLDIKTFAGQVLAPQVRAVAEKLESVVAAEMTGATYATSVPFVEGDADKRKSDPYLVAVAARKALNKADVPLDNRVLLLGADVEAAFLGSDKLVKVNESGSSSALRDASIGRLAGFELLTSNGIPADKAIAFHKSAFVLGNVAPVVPDGATYGSSQNYQGLALRWLRDYDPNFLRDRSVVSSFAGSGHVVDPPKGGPADAAKTFVRAVKINFTPAA